MIVIYHCKKLKKNRPQAIKTHQGQTYLSVTSETKKQVLQPWNQDGKVVIDGGKLAKVEMNMPRDTMEILEASADFYTWVRETGADFTNISTTVTYCFGKLTVQDW